VAARPTVAVPEHHAKTFFDHFAAVGWMDGKQRRISDMGARLRKWKTDQPSHGKTGVEKESTLINTWHSDNPDMTMRKAF